MFTGAKLGIGPAIENGFYYDFDLPRTLILEDLPQIEEEMRTLAKKDLAFEKSEVPIKEAIEITRKANQPYKLELLEEIEADKVTFYQTGDFVDLCRGPHLKSTGEIKHFKLLSIAGAYWRGDEKNPMLQRIYGTCHEHAEELEEYLKQLKEIEKRDHRKINEQIDLYEISDEVGAGLVIWHPKGAIVRQIIEDFWKTEHKKRGYQYLYTPHIGKLSLWQKSGHWQFYRENLYAPMEIDSVKYLVKPMNCPFHLQYYKSDMRSYRDLPMRLCELGTVYRYERAGTLHGLLRVRGFTQDDAHIFCRLDQLKDELIGVLDLAIFMLKKFGFEKFEIDLSLRDSKNKTKYMGDDKHWDAAEEALETALKKKGLDFKKAEGEAVFYGPKIDIKLIDSLGRGWQGPTIQVDFNFPEKFGLFYIDERGEKVRPVMVHRTVLGSIERFMASLIEHYAGAFPVWLAPVQVIVIPVSDKHLDYAKKVTLQLSSQTGIAPDLGSSLDSGSRAGMTNNIRVELDDRSESVGKKIRDSELQKVPYIIVVGDKEEKAGNITIRTRGSKELKEIKVEDFAKGIEKEF